MKLSRNCRLMLMLMLILILALILGGCTNSNSTEKPAVKQVETSTVAKEDKPTEKVESPDATENATVYSVGLTELTEIRVQSLSGLEIDGYPEQAFNVKVFSEASEALENPLTLKNKNEQNYKKISFLYSEDDTFCDGIIKALNLESNSDVSATIGKVEHIGNIATFSIDLTNLDQKGGLLIYEIRFLSNSKVMNKYIAFQINNILV